MRLDRVTDDAAAALHPNWKADDHLIAILARNARDYPNGIAMRERDHGIWHELTWPDYLDVVLALAAGFEEQGIGRGDVVLVVGDNRPQLYFAMLALVCLRAVPSPAYSDAQPSEILGQMQRENICAAVAEDQEQVDKIESVRGQWDGLRAIYYDDPRGLDGAAPEGAQPIEALIERGRARLAGDPALRDDLLSRPNVHDTAVLLHSSGTTGAPKGIPLKHGHVLAGVRNAAAAGYFRTGEQHMAYLPMAWVGDFAFSIAAGLELRFTVNIPENQETALHDLREIAPTLYFASPRAWSGMLTRIQVGIAETTGLKRRLYDHFMPFAIRLEEARMEGKSPSVLQRLWYRLGDLVIYGPIRDQLGLRKVERPYTAGEAIGEDVFLYFRALGLNLRQFYGQTENCALAVAQSVEDISLTTVGRPFPGIELKIDDTGEILIRGDNVFDGYFQNEKATAEALRDGWLCTGDAGEFSDDGQLVVLGRLSEVVHKADGTRFIPTYLENRLKFSPNIRDVCVIGAGREFLSAIVCIDFSAVGQWAQERGVPYTSYAELSQRPEVRALIAGEIAHLNNAVPETLFIRRMVNLHKEFDPDDGEVTRTRKLRRNVIDEHYKAIIDAVYAGEHSLDYEARITYETGQTGTLTRRLEITDLPEREG
ncbi:long-chain acyl-CoA synthetase [Lutimaribacter pacificus]|uniref:Long-chain acyl-CoA synthetase n=1 Tax=Lutimaribacter pacificus TaxID=391948 RepID=A0A1H0D3Z7_9RHOB|nr:AMP-binding protein [Lutimaribacter pacificus]SDN64835.1 long-chain acyl-CoA synthetase [Lutimaribacter pacificus]SHJ37210.1 long-chain acyl-CoA synthetase [Lutimaribacter pacificus]